MPVDHFEATVRTEAGGVAVLDLLGDIDGQAVGALNGAYDQAAESNASMVVLNFTETAYINSTGIALIVGLLGRARKERRRIAACGLSDHYREIFEVTRLADFISIFPDEATVLANETAGH